jgi:hypothetical protein
MFAWVSIRKMSKYTNFYTLNNQMIVVKTYKGLKKDQQYHAKMALTQCIWNVCTTTDVKKWRKSFYFKKRRCVRTINKF